jgi:hypothetical protein
MLTMRYEKQHHEDAGMSSRPSRKKSWSQCGLRKRIYASHAVKYPGSKSWASVKRFRVVLKGHFGFDLLAAAAEPSLDTRA